MSHHISECNKLNANTKFYKGEHFLYNNINIGFLSALKMFEHSSGSLVMRMCCKSTFAWSSIKKPQLLLWIRTRIAFYVFLYFLQQISAKHMLTVLQEVVLLSISKILIDWLLIQGINCPKMLKSQSRILRVDRNIIANIYYYI